LASKIFAERFMFTIYDGANVVLDGLQHVLQMRRLFEVEGVNGVPGRYVVGLVGDNPPDQVRVGIRDGRNCGICQISSGHSSYLWFESEPEGCCKQSSGSLLSSARK
jgi:hypothetical protein